LIVSGYGRVCVLLNQHASREQLVAMRDSCTSAIIDGMTRPGLSRALAIR
jgi:hypothetical protein